MASFSDKVMAVAGVYAEALLALAERRGEADALREELDELAAFARRDRDFARFLESPMVETDERAESLERMLRERASDLLVDALQVINRKGRIALVPAIAAAYRAAHDRLRRRVAVQVTSAVELTEEQRSRLLAAVQTSTGLTGRLEVAVDKSLLGGLVVRIGDQKTDATVATRLVGLSQALRERGSREILSGSYVAGADAS